MGEAWEGWVRPVGLLVVVLIGFLAYRADLVQEATAGFLVVATIALGPAALAGMPAWELARARGTIAKAAFVVMMATWLVGVGYPSLRAAAPPRPLAEAQLKSGQLSRAVKVDKPGAYEVVVSGHFKRAGTAEAEASYVIEARSGEQREILSGTLVRTLVHVRAGRRGGVSTSLSERTENVHGLTSVRGPEITFSADALNEQLSSEGLFVGVRPAGPSPFLFWILGGIAVALALVFDATLTEPRARRRTQLTVASGVALAFSVAFPTDATPHALVRPAIGALVLALVTGGLGGWLLIGFVRLAIAPRR